MARAADTSAQLVTRVIMMSLLAVAVVSIR